MMNVKKFACVAEAVAEYYNAGYVTRAMDDTCRYMVNDKTKQMVLITKVGFLDVEAAESSL